MRLSNVLARLHRHHDNMSSARAIVHRASPNLGIGSTEHERPEWVDSGRYNRSATGQERTYPSEKCGAKSHEHRIDQNPR
jgi:hypothetical protein